jgi:ribonuclease P protein component
VSILVSVPKRRFHHAVDRNRMKRQIREAYRLNKHILWNKLGETPKSLAIAFICIADKPCSTANVMSSVKKILHRIEERTEV